MRERKFLAIIPTKKIGGTTTSLKEFIVYLNKKNIKTDVICLDHQGNFELGGGLLFCENKVLKALISPKIAFQNASFKEKIKIIISYIFHHLKYEICINELGRITDICSYEMIIAYEEGEVTKLVSHVKSCNKIAWIHCDYKRVYNKNDRNFYKKFSKIICVSETTGNSFIECFPELKNSTVILHNLINSSQILKQSKVEIDYKKNRLLIVSLGRLDRVKQFEKLPVIAKILKEKGLEFEWILIGGGNTHYKKEIMQEIDKQNVEDCFKMLGEIKNPYPYIALSDIVVCSSLSEACPFVIKESMVLNKFILSSNFASANEVLSGYTKCHICELNEFAVVIFKAFTDKLYQETDLFDYNAYNKAEEERYDKVFMIND